MSDLGGGAGTGRASNGGARTAGPVPVSTGATPNIRTPRDIMKERERREARKVEEQRRAAEEARRRSAEARINAVTRSSRGSSQYEPDPSISRSDPNQPNDGRIRVSRGVSGADAYGELAVRPEPPRTSNAPRPPRPDPSLGGATVRRTQQNQPDAPRPPGPQQTPKRAPAAGASGPAGDLTRVTSSTFPHAFERWEQLSSHWEGLTSYWLHKLEQNTEEIRETIPNASTLNRQITDLSAAGANLFHAVVELQRLRASSERKFQRWFFETRAENERNSEIRAGLERSLQEQKSAREEIIKARSNDSIAVENAKREVQEMRRELMISKDEARRAWEELGRRNQESLDTAQSLKEGRMTVVAGVQVVPYFGQPSRTESISQRPVTRDGQGYTGTGLGTTPGAGTQSRGDERQYYREGPSPTNTDPFTDSGRPRGTPRSAAAYQTQGVDEALAGATAAPAGQYRRSGDRSHVTSGDAERFYQHAGTDTLLHSPETSRAQPASVTQPLRDDIRSEGSFVDTVSEGGTEYAIDASGNVQRDEHGHPIIFQRRRGAGGSAGAGAASSSAPLPRPPQSYEDDDDFDTEETIRQHERELAAQYSSGLGAEEDDDDDGARNESAEHDDDDGDDLLPEAPSVPFSSTSADAMAAYAPGPLHAASAGGGGGGPGAASGSGGPVAARTSALDAPQNSPADYEGTGFDNWEDRVRGATTHHHPTRLSDVLEEEEERSSRRTAD